MGAADRNARLHAERRRLEAAEATALAVAAERERAASVLDAVGDGIFLVDSDGVVRFWNRAAALITGRSASEGACDRPAAETFADWESLVERIPVAEHGKSARSTTLPVTVGAWDLWLSFTAVHGRSGTVYTFRDLTAERGFDQQKSDLIATISHELRTPMAAVYGAAQTLLSREESLDPAKRRDLLEMIATQAARLSQITDEILLATQLDQGRSDPGGAGGRRRRRALHPRGDGSPDVPVEVDVSTEIGKASGAADRIQQVLVNLVDNALKYGAPPIRVGVDGDDGERPADGVRLRPRDPVRRAAPDLRALLPLGTGADARARAARASGCTSRRSSSGGWTAASTVRSLPGAGATFVVELPGAPAG